MNQFFRDFENDFNDLKDAVDQKIQGKPLIKRTITNKIVPKRTRITNTNISQKQKEMQTTPQTHTVELQTEVEPYTIQDLCMKLDDYQHLLDLRELEIEELKKTRQKPIINFEANTATLKLNQQLLTTQIQLDDSVIKLTKCQSALDRMTVIYNLCVDDYNDMGEEYEKLADQYTKLHQEYQLLLNRFRHCTAEKSELQEQLNIKRNTTTIDHLQVKDSNDLLQSEKERNRALLIQLGNSEELVRKLRQKLVDNEEHSIDAESSKFVSIIHQQNDMIDKLGKTLKSNKVILTEIAKDDNDITTPFNTPPKLVKSMEKNSPFEYTPNSDSTTDLKQKWFETKRELASIELEGVEDALNQLDFHQKELSKLMRDSP